jgi:nitrite reductase/ring-hydroxylating ferredoxin subunit
MPDQSPMASTPDWTRAADLDRLREGAPIAVKLSGKHIALFRVGERVLACNNRCPHEGYPLVEGALDAACRLTCHWHNWKFDLGSGKNEYGGDNLRVYPVRIDGGAVWVDLADAPVETRITHSLTHLDEAMADLDAARIARETARLVRYGAPAERIVAHAIVATHERLRYGMTHAYAGTEVWLRLRERLGGDVERLACIAEAVAHIAFDVRGEPEAPYCREVTDWSESEFASAVEAQAEDEAIACVNGAIARGMRFADLEPALTRAALAHYNDFGHSLIYLTHVRRLVDRLGPAVEHALLCGWVRSLVYATREDLLPDFSGYEQALGRWPAPAPADSPDDPSPGLFAGKSIREALEATLRYSRGDPSRLHDALFAAAALNLLRFDESHAISTDNSVADNVGWLDFSHALTFAHALREQCGRLPAHAAEFWPRGLLQLALFVGRNKPYLAGDSSLDHELRYWDPGDEAAFEHRATRAIVDHGLGLPIFPVHWLKTWMAVADECAAGLSPQARRAGLAAVNRLLAVRFKQRHALRNAHQALAFVSRED